MILERDQAKSIQCNCEENINILSKIRDKFLSLMRYMADFLNKNYPNLGNTSILVQSMKLMANLVNRAELIEFNRIKK